MWKNYKIPTHDGLYNKELIKKYKLENSLTNNCVICLDILEKENKVWELPCEHVYHEKCIEKHLREYNYKCPVCRKRCGKGKVNL